MGFIGNLALLPLVVAAAPCEQKVARLIEKGDDLQIQIQGHVRPFQGSEAWKVIVGPDMYVTTENYSKLLLNKGSAVVDRLSLTSVVSGWLDKNLIGGPVGSNSIREHMKTFGWDLQPQVSQAIPLSDGTAIALVTFAGSISGSPSVAELVRLTLKPFGLRHLRSLSLSRPLSYPPRLPLFRYGSQLLFADRKAVWRYLPNDTIQKVFNLPADATALAGSRWLILQEQNSSRYRVISFDLSTHRTQIVFEKRGTSIDLVQPIMTWPDSRYIQLEIPLGSGSKRYTIRADTSVRAKVPDDVIVLGDYGCRYVGKGYYRKGHLARHAGNILVYDLRTGKLVQTLKIPDFQR